LSDLTIFHPASVEEARALLAASPMPVDSPTQPRNGADTPTLFATLDAVKGQDSVEVTQLVDSIWPPKHGE